MPSIFPCLLLLFISQIFPSTSLPTTSSFTFNGFEHSGLYLDGVARILPRGLLQLSNNSASITGHAFYPTPFQFKDTPNDSTVYSFSTHFVFQIVPQVSAVGGQGITFVLAPTRGLPGSAARGFIGLFNDSTNHGNISNHIFAVELDTFFNPEYNDSDANHIGIDINSLFSIAFSPAGYYDDRTGHFVNLGLNSSTPMQLWVDYNGTYQTINVTLAPMNVPKPRRPLLSTSYNLSTVINQNMYVGFSTAAFVTSHYVMGWSFAINGQAPRLDLSKLPTVEPPRPSRFLLIGLPIILGVLLIMACLSVAYYLKMKAKYAEVIDSWELDYVSHRFKYKDLYVATKGFRDSELLGLGGFGKVYKGLLRGSNTEVAVKRISHESRQGIKEFVAEIFSIGRLRHRNLVPLLGYCRRQGELLLVYEYMPNGNLDEHLHGGSSSNLNWAQRFHVIKGVAYGLLYLHEEWEQVVIHRDIKPSNVLLDAKLNARLGDFGLARLHDHGSAPSTTRIVGTLGYLAPEHTQTGRATKSSDVYGFGALLLEVITGKRPIGLDTSLAQWVHSMWIKNGILAAMDPNLNGKFPNDEAELTLKLGLMCSCIQPDVRPSIRDIVAYLEDPSTLPVHEFSGSHDFAYSHGFDYARFMSSTSASTMGALSISTSLVAGGR